VKNDGICSSLLKYLSALRAWKKADAQRFTRRYMHAMNGLRDIEAEIEGSVNPYHMALLKSIDGERQRIQEKLDQVWPLLPR
jgi:hypothetical protein